MALVDPVKLGSAMVVFVTVRAAEHSDEWLAAFAMEEMKFTTAVPIAL